jgi:hypothetical protein
VPRLESVRGCQGDHGARRLVPLSGRQGVNALDVTFTEQERPVDTIAGARELAEALA